MAETPLDEKHPDWYTWTWDVWVTGGRWRAEYGWEHPPVPDPSGRQIRRNLKPLFTAPQPKAGEVTKLRAEATRLREALADIETATNYSPHRAAGTWDENLAKLIHAHARLLPGALAESATTGDRHGN